MTNRRVLDAGPEAPASGIRATQTDLMDSLPGIRLPDLGELRACGVLEARPGPAGHCPGPRPRRRRQQNRRGETVTLLAI